MNYKIKKLKNMSQEKESNTLSPTADRELIITRQLNAPVELVWMVWTNPEHIKNWWGPNGFTNTISKMDMKPGGEWDLVMHGPDGTNYKNKSVFKEIVKYKKIVYEHVTGPKFTATVEFEKQGSRTFLKWHMLFETKEEFIQTVKTFKADEGLKQNVSKLDNYLTELSKPFTIERTFNAPVEKVWKAITDKNEMKKWYFDLKEFKPEVGFEFEFTGQTKTGEKKYHVCMITDVIKNKKLRHSWGYVGHEGVSFVTFELFDEGDKTRLKLTHEGLETFPITPNNDFAKENFATGWTHIIGKSLQEYLSA